MKQLLHFFFFTAFLFPLVSESQDRAFTLRGKLQQPSSVSSILIAYPKMHMDSIPIQADGSFTYSGNFSEPGEMQITTRKSTTSVWLDSSIKNVFLSEKPNRNDNVRLTVDSVIGSEDTYLYYYTLLPKEGKVIYTSNIKRSFYLEKEIKAFQDSLSKATKPFWDSLRRANTFQEIDSVFKVRPDSRVLPWLIRFYEPNLGIDLMRGFYYRLNTTQQQSKSGEELLQELNKLQLLKPGNIFDDFTMKDDRGKRFNFSSLKSKYILINFWASYCGPCRDELPYLWEAYQKTKIAGLEIVSISLDEDRKKWLDAIKQDKLEWINVSDLKGANSDLALKYKINGIPFSVLLDENRKVILVNPSPSQIIEFFNTFR